MSEQGFHSQNMCPWQYAAIAAGLVLTTPETGASGSKAGVSWPRIQKHKNICFSALRCSLVLFAFFCFGGSPELAKRLIVGTI